MYNSNTPSLLNTPSSHSNSNVYNRSANPLVNNSDITLNEKSSNILLTPLNHNHHHHHPTHTPSNTLNTTNLATPFDSQYTKIRDDFTDAQLLIKRDVQGKHNVSTILLQNNTKIEANVGSSPTTTTTLSPSNLNKSLSNLNLSPNSDQSQTYEMNTFKNSSFLSSLKQQKGTQGSSSGILNINSASPFTSKLIGKNPSSSQSGTAIVKTESLLKNKMKKLINRIPSSQSSHALFPQTSNVSSSTLPSSPQTTRKSSAKKPQAPPSSKFQTNGHHLPTPPPLPESILLKQECMSPPKTGLLKFNRTNESTTTSVLCQTGKEDNEIFNLNEQTCFNSYSSIVNSPTGILENTPIYTETKLPPRILKKYQKQRAMTEAIVKGDDNDIGKCFLF